MPRLQKITDGNRDEALRYNRNKARRRFLLLLYARYFCFRVFLQSAVATGGITDYHKLRWLLIQIAPETLLNSDIFLDCLRLAGGAPTSYFEKAITEDSRLINQLLQSTLVCVLDEAQLLTKDSDYFQSETDPEQRRPILREILRSWRSRLPNLIVSGTGISMQEVGNVITSVVAKERPDRFETVTEIGGFDDEDGQRAYLEEYLPHGYLDTSEGKEIASRVGYWLRGRFVFNAAV